MQKKTEFYNEIKELGTKYTDEDKERDDSNSLKLMELAKKKQNVLEMIE